MTKYEREIFFRYLDEKGYKLGVSTFDRVSADYKPKDNERWNDHKSDIKDGKRELETIVEPGISNKYQLRDEMNIIYFLDLEKSMPAWPWPFVLKKQADRLF